MRNYANKSELTLQKKNQNELWMNALFGTDGCKQRVRSKQCYVRSLAFLGKHFKKEIRMLKIVVSLHTDGHTATKSDPLGERKRHSWQICLLCKNL